MDTTVPTLKVGMGWIELEIISEPDVVLTVRGYAPVLRVRKSRTEVNYLLHVSAKSIADPLDGFRKAYRSVFKGIRLRIRKESMERTSKYQVEAAR